MDWRSLTLGRGENRGMKIQTGATVIGLSLMRVTGSRTLQEVKEVFG